MRLFQKGELKLLWPFYLDSLISPMLFFMPAFAIVYFRDLGFSLFQIGLVMAMMPLFMLLFEIPTGAVADLYGRKFSVLLGYFLEGAGMLSLFFLSDLYLIMGAFALIGFGSTFSSGAQEAWVTDLIKHEKKDYLHGYFTKRQSIDSAGLLVSGFLGAFLVVIFGVSVIWPVAALSFLVSIMIMSFAGEYFVKKNVKVRNSLRNVNRQALESINYSRKHHVLYYFFIASAILVFASVFASDLSWITFLQELGFPDYAFGYMWSAMAAVGIIAPFVSQRFAKKGNEKGYILSMIIIVMFLSLSVIFVDKLAIAFSLLLLILFFIMAASPAERIFFHRFVPSKMRASIGSVESMVLAFVGIIALPLVGLVIDLIGAQYTIALAGILMIPAAIIFYRIKEEKT
jgi:MFS family permease